MPWRFQIANQYFRPGDIIVQLNCADTGHVDLTYGFCIWKKNYTGKGT